MLNRYPGHIFNSFLIILFLTDQKVLGEMVNLKNQLTKKSTYLKANLPKSQLTIKTTYHKVNLSKRKPVHQMTKTPRGGFVEHLSLT